MRVLHVDSALSWRGGQNQVLLSASGMASRGHDVAVACLRGGALEERTRGGALPVYPVSFRGDLWPAAALSLARAFRAHKPDVVQLHDAHALTAGLLAARLAPGPRLVATRRVDFALRGFLSRVKYTSSDAVIAVSRAVLGVLERGGVDPGRIRLVYEGVPDRAPRPGGREVLAGLGVPAGAPVVGNVAALTDHKDHRTLLEAAPRVLERLPEARFVVVGDGELRGALEVRSGQLGLRDRCLFLGHRTDLDCLIPAFTAFCLSSHMEGLGTSLLDAMAFSRPVVATAAGGIPEAVEDGVTGRLVPPRDPVALAGALVEVLSSPDLAGRMGAAGRRRFEERFTAARMVDETLSVYGGLP